MLDASTVEWADTMPMMNAASTTDNTRWHLVDKDTGKRDMDIKRSFDQGDIVKVRIYNDPESAHPMQHPVHFHGQRFLVLNKNGVENQNLVWKDTVLVPTGEYVDILIDMSNPGVWMSHCHIAEHLTAGMMMSFEVKEKE
ncbi:MAG: multicopper oxidase domain-containing protein [Candidatus Peribacteria bacterium]|nr:MAG: multicopper oxidase domain-containing protein [Candidatus Peribacteria bacterium]